MAVRLWCCLLGLLACVSLASAQESARAVLHMGVMQGTADNLELQHEAHNYTIGLGLISPWPGITGVELDLEVWLHERSYDSLIPSAGFTRVDPRMVLTTGALIFAGRLATPDRGGPVLALSGGPGWFMHRLRVTGSTLGLPETLESEAMDLGWQLGGSLELPFGGVLLSAEWRRWGTDGGFSSITESSQDLSADYVGLGIARNW